MEQFSKGNPISSSKKGFSARGRSRIELRKAIGLGVGMSDADPRPVKGGDQESDPDPHRILSIVCARLQNSGDEIDEATMRKALTLFPAPPHPDERSPGALPAQ